MSGMISDDFCNNRINIWVQLHRLPFELRNQDQAVILAGIAGRVKDLCNHSVSSVSDYEGEFPKFRIELAVWIQGFFWKDKEGHQFGFI